MLNNITLLGSSSGRNAGDAALIAGIMASIDKAVGRRLLYDIPTLRPSYVWNNYENRVRPVSMLPWSVSAGMWGVPTIRSVLNADMTLVFDAMLFDRKLFNPLFNYMTAARYLMPLAKKRGKKIGFYNVGLGPVTTPVGRKMLKELSDEVDFITVRDRDSFNLLQELGCTNKNVIITADAAISVKPAAKDRVDQIIKNLGLENQQFIAVNVNSYINSWAGAGQAELTREEFAQSYAQALTLAVAEIKLPILFVATQHSDVDITKLVMSKVRGSRVGIFTNQQFNHHDVKGVLGRAELLFGMRLHSQILASSELVPIGGLVFQKKVASYYQELGLSKYLIPFERFSKQALADQILLCWNDRQEIKKVLIKRIPELIADADRAAQLVAMVGMGTEPGAAIERLTMQPVSSIAQFG